MSCATLREVRLYGHLGREFGRVHRLAVASAAEAIRALCANFPRFEAAVRGHDRFHVLTGRTFRDEKDLSTPVGGGEVIKIVPVVAGAKNNSVWGLVKVVIGIVLIVVGAYYGYPELVQIGIALVLSGLAQALTPTPKTPKNQVGEDQSGYIFSGATNVSAQGATIPVGYGRLIVGSVVASGGVSTEDLLPVPAVPTGGLSGDAYHSGGGNTGTGPYPSEPPYSYPTVPGDGVPDGTPGDLGGFGEGGWGGGGPIIGHYDEEMV